MHDYRDNLDPPRPADPHEPPAAPSTAPSAAREPAATPRPTQPSPTIGITWRLLWLGLVLGLIVALPFAAEQMQYALTRGEMRAKHELASQRLTEMHDDGIQLARIEDTAAAFKLVAQRIEPSVVYIESNRPERDGEGFVDEYDFLRRRFRARGQGSGVVIDQDGYIMTNYHVVKDATQINVRLADGRRISRARLIGADPLTDLAVVKIDAGDLISATWGDSESLDVGDWVLAVGNPFGLDGSVTAGIVSAKGRRGVGESPYQIFLQTDAAVNPGNSGGPLVNMYGEIVGINTAIVGSTYQGVSFAIPSSIAQDVYQKLKDSQRVARGWLGVGLQPLTEELADRFNLETTEGALVTRVLPDSPAEEAGIQPGDLIIAWNDQEIRTSTDLSLAVGQTEIGSKAEVIVIRNGDEETLEVSVGERPPDI